MKFSIATGLAALSALALAAPADHVRRANDIGHNVKAANQARQYYYPTGTAAPYPTPYPTGGYAPYPTGGYTPNPTGGYYPPVPLPTGDASCPVDGAVVCNGPNYFGLCNFGSVVWQRVSDGTACVNGEIVGTGIYAIPTPWPPVQTGYYTATVY